MSESPNEIVDHRPDRCRGCGSPLAESADIGYRRRQVVDVPPVKPVVTEHRSHTYRCDCGCETTAEFTGEARSPVSYGPRTRAVVAYLLGCQHIPNRRVVEAMRESRPRRLWEGPGKTRSSGSPASSSSHDRRTGTVGLVRVVTLSLRPLPYTRTWGPRPI